MDSFIIRRNPFVIFHANVISALKDLYICDGIFIKLYVIYVYIYIFKTIINATLHCCLMRWFASLNELSARWEILYMHMIKFMIFKCFCSLAANMLITFLFRLYNNVCWMEALQENCDERILWYKFTFNSKIRSGSWWK